MVAAANVGGSIARASRIFDRCGSCGFGIHSHTLIFVLMQTVRQRRSIALQYYHESCQPLVIYPNI